MDAGTPPCYGKRRGAQAARRTSWPCARAAEPDSAQPKQGWARCTRAFRRAMAELDAARTLDVLAALSHGANFSVGCCCEHEARCHRSILRARLAERGAKIA
ncbi:DUF488 family protein [Ottowia sp.]|uniref:DUF488 family protein, N3 subclade n=1 Tax=Ottowia sp. TaxID=1898956 RepID=UPI0039E5F48C